MISLWVCTRDWCVFLIWKFNYKMWLTLQLNHTVLCTQLPGTDFNLARQNGFSVVFSTRLIVLLRFMKLPILFSSSLRHTNALPPILNERHVFFSLFFELKVFFVETQCVCVVVSFEWTTKWIWIWIKYSNSLHFSRLTTYNFDDF